MLNIIWTNNLLMMTNNLFEQKIYRKNINNDQIAVKHSMCQH